MKIKVISKCTAAIAALGIATALLQCARADEPVIDFTWPTNGQQIVTLSNIAGTAQAGTGVIQSVAFSIFNQSISQWWNGLNYQPDMTNLSAIVTGTNWTPAPGLAMPAVCCGQGYQLSASVTDDATNSATNITVQADSVAPVAVFAPLTDGQTVTNRLAIGGSVTDNFNLVASVKFAIHELDINSGSGRWWNGTNFQSDPLTLPASLSGTNWLPAPGLALPALNSGQAYQLKIGRASCRERV